MPEVKLKDYLGRHPSGLAYTPDGPRLENNHLTYMHNPTPGGRYDSDRQWVKAANVYLNMLAAKKSPDRFVPKRELALLPSNKDDPFNNPIPGSDRRVHYQRTYNN